MTKTNTHEEIRSFLEATYPSLRIRNSSREATIHCPSHDDKNPSCSINTESGLWHCHSCKAGGDLIDFYRALHAVDFDTAKRELNTKKWRTPNLALEKRIVLHKYLDINGSELFEVVREIDKNNRTIKVWQRKPDGKGGYINNTDGVEKVPYRFNEFTASDSVMITEGEKDVDRLVELGLVATCNPGGAGKWQSMYSPLFEGKCVTILADNDAPGKKHAESVARSLSNYSTDIRIVTFEELPEKSDVSDWLALGNTKQQLLDRIERTPKWKQSEKTPLITEDGWEHINGSQLLDAEFHHSSLIEGLLGVKESLLIVGGSGIGKSLLTNNIALTAGLDDTRLLWGQYNIPRKVKTLFIQAENADHAVQSRLRSMCINNPSMEKAARNQLMFPKVGGSSRVQGSLRDQTFIENIIKTANRTEVELIIIDPLISYAGADENDNTGMRDALDRLGHIMDSTNASVILVHHVAKNNTKGVQGGRGAQSISDWAANIIKLEPVKGHEDGANLFVHHQKARNFEIRTHKFTLQRTANLQFILAENVVDKGEHTKIKEVTDALAHLNGFAEKQGDLIASLSKSTKWSKSEAQRNIKLAVDKGAIEEIKGAGKRMSYRLPETLNPQPNIAEAA